METDPYEEKIIRGLIRNPRISDNQLSRQTGIPLKTVNRKRKILEEKGVLNYLTLVAFGKRGLDRYKSKKLIIARLREGITRAAVIEKIKDAPINASFTKHFLLWTIGEYKGGIAFILIIHSFKSEDIVEIFNAEFVPWVEGILGAGSIKGEEVIELNEIVQLLNYYFPLLNIENGRIRDDWPDSFLFT